MNRAIKFRAWNGEYMEFGGFSIHATGITIITESCLTKVTTTSPIMQFTGLKDKNGKDIYEGDIISIIEKSDFQAKFYKIVEYKYGAFEVDIDDCYGYHLGEVASDENHEGSHECYVCGNIYENPELLEQSND